MFRFGSKIKAVLWILNNMAGGIIRWGTATIIAAVCIVFGFVPSSYLAKIFGTPPAWVNNPWTRISIVGAGVIVVIAIYLWDRRVRPKFSIQFDPVRDVHKNVTLFDQTGKQLPEMATYVSLKISSIGRANINSCSGWIIRLEKLDRGDKSVEKQLEDTRRLPWSPAEHRETQVSIYPDVPRYLGIFRAIENVNRLELLSIGHPPSWVSFFDSAGTYRLTISVLGDGASQQKRLTIAWRGQWNNFDVR